MLDTRYLVARCATTFGELAFDDYLGIELALGHEVGRLVETGKPHRPLGLTVADASARKDLFNGVLGDVANKLADEIAMAGKRATRFKVLDPVR